MLLLLLFLIGVIKYGFFVSPGWRVHLAVAQSWFDPHSHELITGIQDYFLPNSGFSALLGVVGITSSAPWIAVHFIVAVVALFSPLMMPAIRESQPTQRLVFLYLAGGPLLALTFNWIGGYDGFLLLGLVLGALGRSRLVSAIGWLLAGLSHSEVALLGLFGLVVIKCASLTKQDFLRHLSQFAIPILMIALGRLAMMGAVSVWGGSTSRAYLLFEHWGLAPAIESFMRMAPMILFSSVGALWFLLLSRKVLPLRATSLLIALIVAYSIALPIFGGGDATRVVGLSLAPAVLTWMSQIPSSLGTRACNKLWRTYIAAAVIVPAPMITGGMVYTIGWWSFLAFRGIVT